MITILKHAHVYIHVQWYFVGAMISVILEAKF